jgi:hypothetical protein
MQQTEADRQPGRRVHGQIKSSDHASEDVKCKGQPRPTDGFTCLFIHDERVHFCMIDLNDLKWAGRSIVARRRRGGLDDLRFAAPPPSRLQINVFDTGLDRAPVWWPKTSRLAAHLNLAAQSRKRRARRLQIEAGDRLSDDFFARRVERSKTVAPTPRSIYQRRHRAARPEQADHPVGRRAAEPELPSQF